MSVGGVVEKLWHERSGRSAGGEEIIGAATSASSQSERRGQGAYAINQRSWLWNNQQLNRCLRPGLVPQTQGKPITGNKLDGGAWLAEEKTAYICSCIRKDGYQTGNMVMATQSTAGKTPYDPKKHFSHRQHYTNKRLWNSLHDNGLKSSSWQIFPESISTSPCHWLGHCQLFWLVDDMLM